jgi:hypothetical protein
MAVDIFIFIDKESIMMKRTFLCELTAVIAAVMGTGGKRHICCGRVCKAHMRINT